MLLLVYMFCRVALGIAFLISFLSKVPNLSRFEKTITSFEILPKRFVRACALLFLSAEGAVVILLAVGGDFLSYGFVLSVLLLITFSFALAQVLVRGIRTSCNCFGSSAQVISYYDLWRNAGFAFCALLGLVLSWRLHGEAANYGPTEFGLVSLGAIAFVAAWINLKEIVRLLR